MNNIQSTSLEAVLGAQKRVGPSQHEVLMAIRFSDAEPFRERIVIAEESNLLK